MSKQASAIIHHSVGFVNDKIDGMKYFFVDILKEGIMLFDSGKIQIIRAETYECRTKTEKSKRAV
jgi:hypothetical protein